MSSPYASTCFLMNMNSYQVKHWKLLVFVLTSIWWNIAARTHSTFECVSILSTWFASTRCYRVLVPIGNISFLEYYTLSLQTGMRGAYGKPLGTVARVNIGQVIMSVRGKDNHKAQFLEAFRRAKMKFPGRQKVFAVPLIPCFLTLASVCTVVLFEQQKIRCKTESNWWFSLVTNNKNGTGYASLVHACVPWIHILNECLVTSCNGCD